MIFCNLIPQERSRPCSRCSQCSSTVSNSPKMEGSSYALNQYRDGSHAGCQYSPQFQSSHTHSQSQYNLKTFLSSPTVSRDGLRRTSPRLSRQVTHWILTVKFICKAYFTLKLHITLAHIIRRCVSNDLCLTIEDL